MYKFLYVLCLLLAGANARADHPLLQEADMLLAHDGEVVVYYLSGNDKDGYQVVIRNCGDNYPNVIRREDCKAAGPENRVPREVFKRVLKQGFLTGNPDKLKPFTPAEVQAYRAADPNQLETLKVMERRLTAEIARIKAYIAQHGPEEIAKARLSAAEQELTDVRARLDVAKANAAVVKKVGEYVNWLVNSQVANSRKMYPVTVFKDGDTAMYNLLRLFDASKGECGTDEILGASAKDTEERVRNCTMLPGSLKKFKAADGTEIHWNLVTRARDLKTGKFLETWRDSRSQLVWGDALASPYTHFEAHELSASGSVTKETACESAEGRIANGGIGEKRFALPTIDEYRAAQADGVLEILPNMGGLLFWSATLTPDKSYFAQIFDGNTGYSSEESGSDFRENANSVRCVGR